MNRSDFNRFGAAQILTICVTILIGSVDLLAQGGGRTVQATSCFLRTYEEADIPALERGAIANIGREIGEFVEAGTLIAYLDDNEAKVNLAIARLELEIAKKQFESSVAVEIVEARVQETERVIDQALAKKKIAEQSAVSSVELQKAIKARDTAMVELNRAITARNEFSGSVSESELDRLQYVKDQSELDIVSAREADAVADLNVKVEQAAVETTQAAVQRARHELTQAKAEHAVKEIELERLRKQVEVAEARLKRRSIYAPFSGMLTEQYHHRGEWLDPGQEIYRIVRLDRLVVEGYANANEVHHSMRGNKVVVSANTPDGAKRFSGELSFISPTVDPVNGQVQIKAVIENPDGVLRPGEPVNLTIQLQ